MATIIVLIRPVFDGFFYGENWNDYALFLNANRHFIRAIFSPIGPFFRPAVYAWVVATQLFLPWNIHAHMAWNLLFIFVNTVLLHRVMLRLTDSCMPRAIGIAFFSISKIFITLVGVPLQLEMVAQLLHFEAVLLCTLLYLQENHRIYFILSTFFFTLCLFLRDASIALISVIAFLFLWHAHEKHRYRYSFAKALLPLVPFAALATGYLLVRFLLIGLPPKGGDYVYAITLDPIRALTIVRDMLGVLLNLANGNDNSFGYDLVTFAGYAPNTQALLRAALLSGGGMLFLATVVNALRRKPVAAFCLIWMAAVIGPVSLTRSFNVYYAYEVLAAMSVLTAIGLEGNGRMVTSVRCAWIPALGLFAANTYIHNTHDKVLGWRFASDHVAIMNRQIFAQNRGGSFKTLTIVANNQQVLEHLAYILGDAGPDGRRAMLVCLMPSTTQYRVRLVTEAALSRETGGELAESAIARLAADPFNLVYLMPPDTFSFKRVLSYTPGNVTESFESPDKPLTKVWVVQTATRLVANQNLNYVSDGKRSLELRVTAGRKDTAHYGGVKLPLPPGEAFSIDMWVQKPEDVGVLHVWRVNRQGNPNAGCQCTDGADFCLKSEGHCRVPA